MKRASFLSAVAIMAAAVLLSLPRVAAERQYRTLTGHVVGAQDQPIAKAIVYLKNTKSLAVKTYISDEDGSYRFPALSTVVDYEVYAEHNGQHSDTKTLSAFDNRKQVHITLRIKSK